MTVDASTRLMVLMFTDVADSTGLKSRLGASEFARLLTAHDACFRKIVGQVAGAEVLKDLGDGFMARFDTASHAVEAALRFQWEMDRHQGIKASKDQGEHAPLTPRCLDPSMPSPLKVRIGLHLGEVTDIGTDIHGKPKIVGLAADLAARVMSLALPGQILMTRAAFDDSRQYVREHPRKSEDDASGLSAQALVLKWMAHGQYLFKGSDEPLEVFEVGAPGSAPLRAPKDTEKARRAVRVDEEETLGWRPAVGLDIPHRHGWTLERELGVGGFGEVWLGVNSKMRERRVFKFCFDPDRLRSFRRELTLFRLLRDALGDRPDIARLHEVQLDKAPYYLESEYSELGNLAEWSATQGGVENIPLADRIEIVARIADAVAAAHSVGVLHKDIKPTNILMYKDPSRVVRPRISDFGIGILSDRTQLEARGITIQGFTVTQLTDNSSSRTGTRMYSPPESQLGRPFTVQGDVYGLGVLLFQMVVGDLNRPLAQGWEQSVPDRLLREDISACVQGDPAKRLAGAADLTQRLRRLRPRRKAARVRRLARIAGIVGVVYLGLFGLLVLRWRDEMSLRQRSELERDKALVAEKRAMATTDFLQQMLESVDPSQAKGREMTVRDVLDKTSSSIGESLKDQPEVESAVRYTMGRVYFSLSDYPKAEEHLRRSLELQKKLLGDDHEATMLTVDALAAALIYEGKLDEAEPLAIVNLQRRTRVLGPEHDQTLASMGRLCWVHQDRGRYEQAADLHREAIEIKKRVLGPEHVETIESMATFADLLEDMGKLDEAELVARQAVEASTKSVGLVDVHTATAMSILASIQQNRGRYDEAEALCRQVLEIKMQIYGAAHSETLVTQNVLALTLERLNRSDESAEILRKITAAASQSLGPEHDTTLTYKGNLARAEHLRKNYDEAARIFYEVLEAHQRIDGPDAQGTLVAQNNLALLLLDMGKPDDAARLFDDMAPRLEKLLPSGHWMFGALRVNQGECLKDLKRYDEAEPLMLEGHAKLKAALGDEHTRVKGAAKSLADLYQLSGKAVEEARWRAAATPPESAEKGS
jgi:class 3 adenylate cyclase/serine/threonine protein kinase